MTLSRRIITARTLVAALALLPAAVSAQQSGRSPRPSTLSALGIHGFSVVLVVGSLNGTPAPGATAASDGVPEAAKKALADMKDFLPYKRYQLLDAAWMMCCASPRAGVSGRVRGPDERDYRYEVDPLTIGDAKLNVRLTIREVTETRVRSANREGRAGATELEHSRQLYDAMRERDEAEAQLRSVKQRYEVGLVPASELEALSVRSRRAAQRVEDLQQLAGGGAVHRSYGQNIIDSTFAITPGETVVVGTSRLNGDRALIAILTAAAKPAGAPREQIPNP
jgi:hypothetical protein